MLVLGEKEVEGKCISVRDRDGQESQNVDLKDFISQIQEEIKEKSYR